MITYRQLRLLSEAVDEAESWRGSLIGAAPFEVLDEFDERILKMRQAVESVKSTRLELLNLRARMALK